MNEHEWQLVLQQAHQIGESLGVQRDYRKECWITVYAATLPGGGADLASSLAGQAVLHFDKAFP